MGSYHRIGRDGHKYRGTEGAGIAFTDGNKILLLRRADGDEKGTWGIPGGKAEPGELPIDAAIRESEEECGVEIQGQRMGKFEEPDNAFRWTTFLYHVRKPFDCKLSHEHDDWEWVDLKEVEGMTLHSKFRISFPCYWRAIKRKLGEKPSFKEWFLSSQ